MQRFSLVWWLRSSLNNSGVIPANPGSESGVARAGIQEFQRLLDTGLRRYDGEDLNDLFNELWFQDTSRKFGLYPFSVSSWTESKAAASRALTSRTADHLQENYPPVLCRSSLPKVFHQSSYHPWVCSVPDTTKLMTRCGVSEIRYICSCLAPTKNLPSPSFPKRGVKIPLPKRERQVFALCAWLRAPCSNVPSTPSRRS